MPPRRPSGFIDALAARELLRVPNLLSLARLPLGAVFPLTFGHAHWAIGVLALAAATDVADGWYARRFHQETRAGTWLDPLMDKTFVLAVLVTMLAHRTLSPVEALLVGTRELGEVPLLVRWWIGRGRVREQRRAANRMGKLATVGQFVAVAALIAGAQHRGVLIGGAASWERARPSRMGSVSLD